MDTKDSPEAVAADALAYVAAMRRRIYNQQTTTELCADLRIITNGWSHRHGLLVLAFLAGVCVASLGENAHNDGRDPEEFLQEMILRAAGA